MKKKPDLESRIADLEKRVAVLEAWLAFGPTPIVWTYPQPQPWPPYTVTCDGTTQNVTDGPDVKRFWTGDGWKESK